MATSGASRDPSLITSDVEWAHRVELAAFYRIVALLGWDELIIASSLLKIDLEGNLVEPSPWLVNKAGFMIHSAIHDARQDAHCVLHVHTTAGMAVAQQPKGLQSTSFYSAALYDHLSYHDFEGSVVTDGEKVRLVQSLGTNNHIILRNHGLLTCGPTPAATFSAMYTLQRACEVQIAGQAGGDPLIEVPEEIRSEHRSALNQTVKDAPANDMARVDQMMFDAMVRRIDRIDPSYKN